MNHAFADITEVSSESPSSSGSTVLIIEDCEPLLFYLNSALLTVGYKNQFLAANLAEAQAAWAQHKHTITHVLLNYELPDGLAFEFAALILRERPDVNIVITTGYDVASVRDSTAAGTQRYQFLQKPFRLAELKDALEADSSVRALSV